MTVAQRVAVRLTEQGLEPVGGTVGTPHRTYAGYWQRKEGTWSWGCQTTGGYVGSPVSMTEMLKCRHTWPDFTVRGTTDREFHPCDECTKKG